MRKVGDEVSEVMEGLISPLRTSGFSLREMGAIGAFKEVDYLI